MNAFLTVLPFSENGFDFLRDRIQQVRFKRSKQPNAGAIVARHCTSLEHVPIDAADNGGVVVVLLPSGERAFDSYLLWESRLDQLAQKLNKNECILLCLVYSDMNLARKDFLKYETEADRKTKSVSVNYLPKVIADYRRRERLSDAPRHHVAPLCDVSEIEKTASSTCVVNLQNNTHALASFLIRQLSSK